MPFAHTTESVDIHGLPPIEVIFGRSSSMAAAREKLERIAETTVPVLLQGESGTGKEIFAKLLHAKSNRSRGVWVKVACPAIPHTLIESELFGYEKGAFSGAYATKRGRVELAHMGTLFLDEIGDLDLSVQAKLLQMLQDGSFMRVGGLESRTVNTRLVSATSNGLQQQVENGSFRLDFLYRINAVTIDLPPLRQRTEDLPMLTDYFLELHAKTFRNNPKPLSREMTRLMQRYDWPGNIRQLENMLRGYVLIGSEEVLAAELVASVPASLTRLNTEIDLTSPILLKEVTKAATQDLERQIILKVLESNGWSRRKTAKWLNISYRSLLYKLQNSQAAEFSESPLMTGILNSMANLTQTMGPPKEVGRAGVSQESAVLKRLSYIQPRTA
ncbi:MAG TPA: sigma 54-interacting transcriptional regulator [Terracidiphilus sp.]|jgi:two-component system response regulator AtoC